MLTALEELILMGFTEKQVAVIIDVAYMLGEHPTTVGRLLTTFGDDAHLANWHERAKNVTDYIKKHAQ